MCNLRCTYCYLGEKRNEKMSFDTAKNSVEFAINKIKNQNHKNRRVSVDFIGGEPLISFTMVRDIVFYCEQRGMKENISFRYTITTNGTIFNDEMFSFFVKYEFLLKISLDGDEHINDLNRKDCNGLGSFQLVKKNLHYIRAYENETKRLVKVSNVLTKNNYKFYDKSIKYLVEKLGFRYVDTGFNSKEIWSESELQEVDLIMKKILCYYFESAKARREFVWGIIEDGLSGFDNVYRTYSCGAGIVSYYISYSGKYFLCPSIMEKKYCLGDVNNQELKTEFSKFICENMGMNKIQSQHCQACKYEPYCTVKGCFAASIMKNGSIHIPSQTACMRKRLLFDMIGENYFEIQKVKKESQYMIEG